MSSGNNNAVGKIGVEMKCITRYHQEATFAAAIDIYDIYLYDGHYDSVNEKIEIITITEKKVCIS